MQTTYSHDFVKGQAGLKADIGNDNVLTYRAFEDIAFGFGLVQAQNADRDARLPLANTAVITFDGDLIASNVVNLDVNGESIDPVTFSGSHATTLGALATEIATLDGVSASVTAAREITVVVDDAAALIENIEVTAGESQASGTVVYTTSDSFVGVSLRTHAIEQDADGVALYKEQSAISTLTRGRVYVYAETAVSVGDAVYLRHTADGTTKLRGQFRNDADSNKAFMITGARFLQSTGGAGLTVLEINLPR